MKSEFLSPRAKRIVSKGGTLVLAFQKTPVGQQLTKEAATIGVGSVSQVVKWTVAVVAGLGTYDSVAGATVISQVSPSPGSSSASGTVGKAFTMVWQVTGAPSTAGSWKLTGTLPGGITHANATNTNSDYVSGVPTTSGTFPITVKAYEKTGFGGGSVTKSFTITIAGVPAPTISGQPASVSIATGSTAGLTVTATGATSYQWYQGLSGDATNPISGATAASFTTPALAATKSYWVKVANSGGSVNSAAATVTVVDPVTIATQPLSASVEVGSAATLSVTAVGASSYQWYAGESGVTTDAVAGATSSSFTTPALSGVAKFWVRVRNSISVIDSNTATVSVLNRVAFTTHPSPVTIGAGQSVTLHAVATGTDPQFQWYVGPSGDDSAPIVGAVSPDYATGPLSSSATFWVRASNGLGAVDSAGAAVTVIAPPAITSQPGSATVLTGQGATLAVAADGVDLAYQWFEGERGDTAAPVAGANAPTFTTPAITQTKSFWVRITNLGGSIDSQAATVTVGGVENFDSWAARVFSAAQLNDPSVAGQNADPDGDGIVNVDEYILGTPPLSPGVDAQLTLSSGGQARTLSFVTVPADSNVGGRVRHYALQKSTDGATWSAVAGFEDIIATGQVVTYTIQETDKSVLYRLSVWLAAN